jgi:hypothetical protein
MVRAVRRSSPVVVAVALSISCGASNPAAPDMVAIVSGTWDGRFEGIVQGSGVTQTDTFVMELTQSGPAITGVLRFAGLDLAIPVTGTIHGSSFTYTARAALGPVCEGVVAAETALNSTGSRFTGSQRQSTCEGTAVGPVNASRR